MMVHPGDQAVLSLSPLFHIKHIKHQKHCFFSYRLYSQVDHFYGNLNNDPSSSRIASCHFTNIYTIRFFK